MNTRRSFLKKSIVTSACIFCSTGIVSLLESCESGDTQVPPPTTEKAILNLNNEFELQAIGGTMKKRFSGVNGGRSIIIVRVSEKDFSVFASQCTHKSVEIKLPKDGILKCPAHGSQFKTDGTVIEGQAKKPLYKIAVVFDETKKILTIG